MKKIIIANSKNKPFRHDATGAFMPEARRLAHVLEKSEPDTTVVLFINMRQKPWIVRRALRHTIEPFVGADTEQIYFLCHGWRTGFQAGYRGKSGALMLAHQFAEQAPNLKLLTFYACSMGAGQVDNNFLYWLSEELPEVTIIGHYKAGHTTKNPFVCVYKNSERIFKYNKKDILWPLWKNLLKKDEKLRFLYPDYNLED